MADNPPREASMNEQATPIRSARLCANGCVRRGTEDDANPTPELAKYGNLCARCYRKMFSALELAPDVVEHVVSLFDSKGGQSEDKIDTSRDAPMPFNTVAFNDANEVYQRLVYWSILWAARLHVQAPGPAVRAWRSQEGFVVGLPGDIAPGSARYLVGVMASWLRLKLEEVCYLTPLDDVNYFSDELRDVYRINARWPKEAKPRFSDMPCPDESCGGRIAVYPPTGFGEDEKIQCTGCWRIFLPAQYEHLIAVFQQIKAEANPVARHLMRKYGRSA